MAHMPEGRLSEEEISAMLAEDIPAQLVTIGPDGFPRITPIWFVWEAGVFYMTSYEWRPHLKRLAQNPKAAISIDTEDRVSRKNRQVKGYGEAEVFPDKHWYWTKRIDEKYRRDPASVMKRTLGPRLVISLRPLRIYALGT